MVSATDTAGEGGARGGEGWGVAAKGGGACACGGVGDGGEAWVIKERLRGRFLRPSPSATPAASAASPLGRSSSAAAVRVRRKLSLLSTC